MDLWDDFLDGLDSLQGRRGWLFLYPFLVKYNLKELKFSPEMRAPYPHQDNHEKDLRKGFLFCTKLHKG